MKKILTAALAALAVTCMSWPSFAEDAAQAGAAATDTVQADAAQADAAATYTSPDGVLSIELPGENWKAIQDPGSWIALTDGGNVITIDHFSNGEKLPEMTVADDHYVNVFQGVYSTQNEVFIITGRVVDAAVIPEISEAILSVKVLKYDTKLAVKKDESAETEKKDTGSEFSVAPMSATMYATTGVNVRSGYSTSDAVLGGLAPGSSVSVTGKVQKNGKDYGWYQVSYDGKNAYVSSQFLSDKAPSDTPSGVNVSFTGTAKTIYDAAGNAVTVFEASDGKWYDNSGKAYSWTTDYEFTDGSATYTIYKPKNGSDIYAVGDPFTVYWENGNAETLTLYSDGYYYSSGWVRYWANDDNSYSGADGTRLLASIGGPSTPVDDGGDENTESHLLVSRDTGAQITVGAGGGAYFDSAGTEYSWIDDGGMMDFYGNTYDVIY